MPRDVCAGIGPLQLGAVLVFMFFEIFIFTLNFDDSSDIHDMRLIILGYFFPTIMMEISTFHLKGHQVEWGQFNLKENLTKFSGDL